MKRVTIINGSPRGRRGNTAKLVDMFMDGYRLVEMYADIEYVELFKEKFKNCIGCFSCWTKTPGRCIHDDGMDAALERLRVSDLVIWATPVYHFNMTSIMQGFVERTLPEVLPLMVKNGEEYMHPQRHERMRPRNVVISNCGFPDFSNFDVLEAAFRKSTGDDGLETIFCVMGELLSVPELERRCKWYVDAVRRAGAEFAGKGSIGTETRKALGKQLLSTEDFVEIANASWVVKGNDEGDSIEAETHGVRSLKGLSYLKLMRQSFNAQNADGLDAILEFEFTDLVETHHFKIKDGVCNVYEGESDGFTTKIITSYDTWMKISSGELNGQEALMAGIYRIKGDLNFMSMMGELFGGGSEKGDANADVRRTKFLGISGQSWMGIMFIPWIISWINMGRIGLFYGLWLPFIIATGIVIVKKIYKEVTYFEQMSFLYFGFLLMLNLSGTDVLTAKLSVANYFVMAFIWVASLLSGKALTCDYSKFDVAGNLEENLIFRKTNDILTLFWGLIFVLQGVLVIFLRSHNMENLSPLVYILIIVALKFTKWFASGYPRYLAGGSFK